MLIEFSVGNFRSFRDIVTLSLVAANLKAKNPQLDNNNVFTLAGQPDLLTSAAIYGANASGKSNLVKALNFMRGFVLESPKATQATGTIEVDRFRLSTETESKPAHFEAVFIVDKLRYRYGFAVTPERVESEWLFVVPTIREALLFKREGDEVVLGERFREGKDIIERTRPNALFLSVVAQFNGKIAQRVVGWFRRLGIASGLQDMSMRVFTMNQFLEGDIQDEIIDLIKSLDLGVEELNVEKKAFGVPIKQIPDEMPQNVKDAIALLFADSDTETVGVSTTHKKFDATGHMVSHELFDFDAHESEGTKKLFALAGPLITALRKGRVLIIDEMDGRLHPLMTCAIVRLFNNLETNPRHAQLIFTTHDTNLLRNDLFRRDQIWFTEKNQQGTTDLYSLAEFKVRNDASFQRDYIKGRYGAIPFLDDLHPIAGSA